MTTSLTYKQAGVDIEAGNRLVDSIKHIAKKTHRPGVLTGLGGFGALFEIPDHYEKPVLVSGTDGVGTKLKLASDLNTHDTIGIDLVAMCVNDLIVCGAEPLFFLDYYATGKLNVEQAQAVIEGIAQGCQEAGAALVGGETAEMPGFYEGSEYDLAGFCVGAVEKSQIITGEKVKPGDVLLGLSSSGPHSNGYSLIRKIINDGNIDLATHLEGKPLGEALLAPTRIYVKSLLALIKAHPVHAIAHITGGGFVENVPRVLPAHCCATLEHWAWPELFKHLQTLGSITDEEMLRTFNCGIGMVLCLPQAIQQDATLLLEKMGETVIPLGTIEEKKDDIAVRFI